MNWTCPYCNQPTTLTSLNIHKGWRAVEIAAEHLAYGHRVGLGHYTIACPNKECKKLFLEVRLTKSDSVRPYEEKGEMQLWQLMPESSAKPQPSYIPDAIVNDYIEACRIKNLSPKASATLARRCLQGMIRDFWGIRKSSLQDEIEELKDHLSEGEWGAIDAVRSIGNIGAHMEKDVNIIIDIEPEEADLLIELIEGKFTDWYIVRHEKQQRELRLKELAIKKQQERKELKVDNVKTREA